MTGCFGHYVVCPSHFQLKLLDEIIVVEFDSINRQILNIRNCHGNTTCVHCSTNVENTESL